MYRFSYKTMARCLVRMRGVSSRLPVASAARPCPGGPVPAAGQWYFDIQLGQHESV